jgi:ribonucleoside-diphosphate reductase alpha chain
MAVRHRLPDERAAVNHKFSIGGHEGYLNVGLYPHGEPGELFVTMTKSGSTINGLMDGFAMAVSVGLQHGVPLEVFVSKLAHMRFEPSGFSKYPGMGYAKSILDYIARYMGGRFLSKTTAAPEHDLPEIPIGPEPIDLSPTHASDAMSSVMEFGDAPPCSTCGSITVRSGSCYKCLECGSTTGCS